MRGLNVFKLLLYIFLPILIASFLVWFLQTKKPLRIFILDKSVLNFKYTEHKSFNWVLNNYRITRMNQKPYSISNDYYGFIPVKLTPPKEYKIRSLRLFEVLSICDDIDMAYYTDCYGVYYEDWYNRAPDKLHSSLLYGGLNQNDYLLLSEMKRKNKLIIAEFNMLGSPTSDLIRNKTENLFDFYWTGWTGCYFKSLSITNPNLPQWIINVYEEKNKKKWNFSGQGIVLVNENSSIIVLENNVHLNNPSPKIISTDYAQKIYHLPEYQYYSFWFDIINPGKSNSSIASYQLDVTKEGKQLLDSMKIPSNFPAVIEHLDNYKFYYFAGDFADRNIFYSSSYFAGVPALAKIFSLKSSNTKNAFFWRFYLPLVQNIIKKNVLR
jgi:hypothetical protein